MDDRDLCGRAAAYLVRPDSDERLPGLSVPNAPVLTDLGNGLRVGYAVDLGTHFRYIQRRHLWADGMALHELHRNSVAKLSTMLNGTPAVVHPCADCFLVVFDGHFDASLIRVDRLWDEMLDDFAPNGFVVAVPSKNGWRFAIRRLPKALCSFVGSSSIWAAIIQFRQACTTANRHFESGAGIAYKLYSS